MKMFNKAIKIVGCLIITDISYVIIKKIIVRFYDPFKMLVFGECCSDNELTNCNNKNCSHHNCDEIISLMKAAKYSIDINMYMLTSKRLSVYLLDAIQRGVHVTIIIDTTSGLSWNLQVLRRAGARVGWVQPSLGKLLHHKFCIIDGRHKPKENIFDRVLNMLLPSKKDAILLTGSLNWTQSGVTGNQEMLFATHNPKLIQHHQDVFRTLLEECIE